MRETGVGLLEKWGSQSWLPPAFSRRWADDTRSEPPGKAAAGKIACPTVAEFRAGSTASAKAATDQAVAAAEIH
jgi:hypothetical protein